MDQFLQDEYKEQQKEKNTPGTWASMNDIQKTGVIGCFVLAFGSLFSDDSHHALFEIAAGTSLFLGWVAGSLWKVKRALHFWWSLLVAVAGHLCLLPIYLRMTRYLDASHVSGRAYGVALVGSIALETIIFLALLKKIAMLLHRKIHETSRNTHA